MAYRLDPKDNRLVCPACGNEDLYADTARYSTDHVDIEILPPDDNGLVQIEIYDRFPTDVYSVHVEQIFCPECGAEWQWHELQDVVNQQLGRTN